jgi:hypothetical protein
VKKVEKKKLKCVVLTFFTLLSFFDRVFRTESGEASGQDNERNFVEGWSDPRFTLATEPCAKVGSLQPNTVPFRVHLAHAVVRNLFSFGHLLDRDGEREGDG